MYSSIDGCQIAKKQQHRISIFRILLLIMSSLFLSRQQTPNQSTIQRVNSAISYFQATKPTPSVKPTDFPVGKAILANRNMFVEFTELMKSVIICPECSSILASSFPSLDVYYIYTSIYSYKIIPVVLLLSIFLSCQFQLISLEFTFTVTTTLLSYFSVIM